MDAVSRRLEYYHRLLDRLAAELAWVRSLPCEKEEESPERIAMCAQRKAAMRARAREKGLL